LSVSLLPTVEEVAAPDNLVRTFHALKAKAGQAPGPDGLTYGDLSRREVCQVLRELAAAVCAGTYEPGPGRLVSIPKPGGGTRTLTIRDLGFRVVAAALNEGLTPYWETVFLPCSMGFWPGRGAWAVLAKLGQVMAEEGRWVLATDDVRKAFDTVHVTDIMAEHRRHIADDALLRLTEAVLRGSAGERRQRGIDQGSAYSPTALNVLLHRHHDLGFGQGHPPLYRYADNLAFVCRSVAEGEQALASASRLLEGVRLTLKGQEGQPKDLWRGEEVQLLGFILRRKGSRLRLVPGPNAWRKLQQSLLKAHRADNPAAAAEMAVRGWVNGYGPAFESLRDDTVERILRTTSRYGFREIGSPGELTVWCKAANEHWHTYREKACQSL
jgi:hypothetical protein